MKTLLSMLLLLGIPAFVGCKSQDQSYEVKNTETITLAVSGAT